MTFRILPLPLAPFRPLFELDDDRLAALGACRMIADEPLSSPCRVSLTDAEVGDRLILLNHTHLDAAASPYRANGPIFVREVAVEARPAPGEVPGMVFRRLLSVRIYDQRAMMTDADVVEGADLAERLRAWFSDPTTHQVQMHTARRGCYMARAVRS